MSGNVLSTTMMGVANNNNKNESTGTVTRPSKRPRTSGSSTSANQSHATFSSPIENLPVSWNVADEGFDRETCAQAFSTYQVVHLTNVPQSEQHRGRTNEEEGS